MGMRKVIVKEKTKCYVCKDVTKPGGTMFKGRYPGSLSFKMQFDVNFSCMCVECKYTMDNQE